MKKIMPLLLFIMLSVVFPTEMVQAKPMTHEAHDQISAELNEKKMMIKHHTKENKKMEAMISKKSKQIADLYTLLFSGDMVPSDEKVAQIEQIEKNLADTVQKLIRVEKNLNKMRKEANAALSAEHYDHASAAMDKVATLLETKHHLLMKYNDQLQVYIDFIKALQLK